MNELDLTVNTNPMQFEDLAVSLASLATYAREENMEKPVHDMERLFGRSLKVAPDYHEITALAGHSITGRDLHAGRAAWLLMHVLGMNVQSVNAAVWHRTGVEYYAPILNQLGMSLSIEPSINVSQMQELGVQDAVVDVIGLKGDEIWLVQVISRTKISDSVIRRIDGQRLNRARGTVFLNVSLNKKSCIGLKAAKVQMERAFPGIDVVTAVVVMSPDTPDFEVYQVDLPTSEIANWKLEPDRIVKNSIDCIDEIADDQNSVFRLPKLLTNDSFIGLPPCKGGRTLGALASAVKRQLASEGLLEWGVTELLTILRNDFSYEIEYDKLRHDVDERLTGQGFFRKWGPKYHVSVKGIARYQYCLAKFTTCGEKRFDLDLCIKQRDRIVKRFGCVT